MSFHLVCVLLSLRSELIGHLGNLLSLFPWLRSLPSALGDAMLRLCQRSPATASGFLGGGGLLELTSHSNIPDQLSVVLEKYNPMPFKFKSKKFCMRKTFTRGKRWAWSSFSV